MALQVALAEIFRNPPMAANVSSVYYVVGNGIKFDCYPEIGDNFCSGQKEKICRERCDGRRKRPSREVQSKGAEDRDASDVASIKRHFERQYQKLLRSLKRAKMSKCKSDGSENREPRMKRSTNEISSKEFPEISFATLSTLFFIYVCASLILAVILFCKS